MTPTFAPSPGTGLQEWWDNLKWLREPSLKKWKKQGKLQNRETGSLTLILKRGLLRIGWRKERRFPIHWFRETLPLCMIVACMLVQKGNFSSVAAGHCIIIWWGR